ncbi:hypothetical protein GGD55_006240 [Rhizobium giardinii]|uniref:Uncharacterized protein n=1 Tax=Rhizobium giardinii TaxID=56731 RepID=A0A7W8UJS6_9HYPH|nr:hypothetical protein [Rhizobium giardinii]
MENTDGRLNLRTYTTSRGMIIRRPQPGLRLRLEIGEIGDGALSERGRPEDHPAGSVEVGTNETGANVGRGMAWCRCLTVERARSAFLGGSGRLASMTPAAIIRHRVTVEPYQRPDVTAWCRAASAAASSSMQAGTKPMQAGRHSARALGVIMQPSIPLVRMFR